MAHKKGVGSSRNGRDSHSQRLGLKKFGGEKIIVFKFKRRKQYKRTKGHRQGYTKIKIDSIG